MIFLFVFALVPIPRFAPATVFDKNLYVFGGSSQKEGSKTCKGDADGDLCNDGLWKLDSSTGWTQYRSTEGPSPRRGGSLISLNDRLILSGGGTVNAKNPFFSDPVPDSHWEWNKNDMEWVETSGPKLYAHSSERLSDTSFMTVGGFEDTPSDRMYFYRGGEYEECASRLPPLYGHTLTKMGDSVFLIGGVSGASTDKNAYNSYVWKLNVDTKKWRKYAEGPRIHGHSAVVWSGDKILISGGFFPNPEANIKGNLHMAGTRDEVLLFDVKRKTLEKICTLRNPREFHASWRSDKLLCCWGGYHMGTFWEGTELVKINV